ncbi:GATA-binding factor C [Strongyloides ratti]|uniref:GATA-binding factor C n=1 Tax=Strongyloides ratti TaxID=34506 RepID=A0A090LER4_STRRB|nr:GATA-binding factor C [Strongyloides ratti]CEF68222.1 GATA-binding factor C [Strongyloides ratti]
MENNDIIYSNNSIMDNFNFQTFYNPSTEQNYYKNITSQSISTNKRDSTCIPFQEQEQFKNNFYYSDQSSYYYSQPFDLYNQWIENTTIENVKNNFQFENKNFYSYNIPPTISQSSTDTPNTEFMMENYKNDYYCNDKVIQPPFQQNSSLSSNDLSLTSTPSPPIENDTKSGTVSSHPGMLYLMPTLIRNSKKEKKYDTPKISKGRIAKKPSMHINSSCVTCGTTETTLWRRDLNGFPECNPCNLYYRTHQTKRPPRLFKNGKILKRNGKNRLLKNGLELSPYNEEYDKDFSNFSNNINTNNTQLENNFEPYLSNRIIIDNKINRKMEYFDDNRKNQTPENYFFPTFIDNNRY